MWAGARAGRRAVAGPGVGLRYTRRGAERARGRASAGGLAEGASGHPNMSLPVAAIGALLAALLETSVLPELTIGGLKPDLLLVMAVVVAMVIGFEDGLVWAFVGGLLVDALSGRPLGATALALLLVTGMAALIARFTGTPRLLTVSVVTFALGWLFQALLMAILAATAGVGLTRIPLETFLFIAVLDTVVAVVATLAIRTLLRRFGPVERLDW